MIGDIDMAPGPNWSKPAAAEARKKCGKNCADRGTGNLRASLFSQ
ncbi:hypothetical protein ABID59_002700 [Bradyrhizobium sp. S3.3.6]